MLIPTIFQQIPFCIPQNGILHIGAHKCEEKSLYHSIGIADDNILWIEANPELIDSSNPNMIQAVISDQNDQEVILK